MKLRLSESDLVSICTLTLHTQESWVQAVLLTLHVWLAGKPRQLSIRCAPHREHLSPCPSLTPTPKLLQQQWSQSPSGEPAFSSSQYDSQLQRPSKRHQPRWPTALFSADKSQHPPAVPKPLLQSFGLLLSSAHSLPGKYANLEFCGCGEGHPSDLRSSSATVRDVFPGSLLDNSVLCHQPCADSVSSHGPFPVSSTVQHPRDRDLSLHVLLFLALRKSLWGY